MNPKRLHRQLFHLFQHNLVIKGTLILTITGLVTRVIGFYNRIFLSHLIGAKELGIYQLIFPIYLVAFSFTTCGNELALTKLVSEYTRRGNHSTAWKFFQTCFVWNLFLAILTASIIYRNADFLCTRILNASGCAPCLRILVLGIPFMAMKGAIHGYFLGLEQSEVHGISDFLEQSAKVIGLYLLATFVCARNTYTAPFAVIGIVIGEIIAFIYSMIALLHHMRTNHLRSCCQPIHKRQIIHLFLKDSIPLTTNRLALTALQSMESILIPSALLTYYHNSTTSLEIYGIFTGMAFPFIMFPATITNSLSTMLLPAVSSANSTSNRSHLSVLCQKSLQFCLLIGIFSTIVFFIYGSDIGVCFFSNEKAGMYLYQLSLLCPFIYLATTLASILNGLGLSTYNLFLTVLATGIRIGFILIFVPKIGMYGYVSGLFISYLVMTFGCLYRLQKNVTFELSFSRDIFFPVICFVILGTASYLLYRQLLHLFPSIPKILTLCLMIGFYTCTAFICKVRPLLR